MTQLIINDIRMPEVTNGRYHSAPKDLAVSADMISGRRVTESRGHVQVITVKYTALQTALWEQLAPLLRSGKTLSVAYLPDVGTELVLGQFRVDSMTDPVFEFSRSGQPYWSGLALTLREVRPHD